MSTAVRFGILGTGRVAAQFARAIGEVAGAELAVVGSRTRGRAEAFARAEGAARAVGSYEELVGDRGVDVVYVATPNACHREHALLALDAGKAVVCEKPFGASAADARAVAERAHERGLFCMEAMWMRFVPAVRELKALVDRGDIGRPLSAHAALGFSVTKEASDPLFDPALGGGALLDLGVYPLALVLGVLGGKPARVRSHALFAANGADEHVAAILDFGERQATITASHRCQLSNDAIVVGEEGLVRVREPLYCPEALVVTRVQHLAGGPSREGALQRVARARGLRWARRAWSRARARARERVIERPVLGSGMRFEIEEIVRCVRDGRRESAVMPLGETIAVLETVDAVRSAWREG